ncbi:hypothetical protein AKJ08_0463 [Vulgatibacter incomptus]|uniref:Exo-alpha-sialidase n=1 Tax=Vulgatibacter incomptus TaxID=1391653 RepID=A0A0K1P9H2_9BACT|nr:hypothetical protein AKJ08_0463 [Vulgatibacter incomptus]
MCARGGARGPPRLRLGQACGQALGTSPVRVDAQEAPTRDPDAVESGLGRIERLVSFGETDACSFDGPRITCSKDGGKSWPLRAELPARAVGALRGSEGILLIATDDGRIFSVAENGAASLRAEVPGEPAIVDASQRDGRLFLLAHRFDAPEDPLRLPQVVKTELLALAAEGSLEMLATSAGFRGDRLLIQPNGELITFASVDARAWRSIVPREATGSGGRPFVRLPHAGRFGADFGGLQVAIDRWADRLPGPGKPARPASALYVSRDDGAEWEHVFDTTGETLVDFMGPTTGLVVAREEGTAWLTTDGTRSFHSVRKDDRLYETVAVTHSGGRFLVASSRGTILLVSPDAP